MKRNSINRVNPLYPFLSEKYEFQNPAPKDLNLMKKKRFDQDVSYSPNHKAEKSATKKALDQHVRNVEVQDSEAKPQLSSMSEDMFRAYITNIILKYLTSESFWRKLEWRTKREINAIITRVLCQAQAQQYAVGKVQDVPQDLQPSDKSGSESRLDTPARSSQKEYPSKLGFNSCLAFLINIALMESRDNMKEILRNMSPIFRSVRNSVTEIMDSVLEGITDLINIEATKSGPDPSEASEHKLYRTDSDDSQGLFHDPMLFTLADEPDEQFPLPTPSTQKPGTGYQRVSIRRRTYPIKRSSFLSNICFPKRDIICVQHKPDWDDSPIGREQCMTRTKLKLRLMKPLPQGYCAGSDADEKYRLQIKPCDLPQKTVIRALPRKAPGELDYLFRPAPGAPPLLPKDCDVGGVGWRNEHGFRLNEPDLTSNHQIKRSEVRMDLERKSFHSQLHQSPWQVPPSSLDRKKPSTQRNQSDDKNHSQDNDKKKKVQFDIKATKEYHPGEGHILPQIPAVNQIYVLTKKMATVTPRPGTLSFFGQ